MVAAVVIAVLGIGATTIIVRSGRYNPRKKWRVLMVIAVFAFVLAGSMTTTYSNGLAHYSNLGVALMWIFGSFFVLGFLGNWVNKY